jgi:protein-tyrosine-phosphatase
VIGDWLLKVFYMPKAHNKSMYTDNDQPPTTNTGGMQTDMHPTSNGQPPATNRAFRVLFVCSGNTCRSPMAAGICRGFLAHLRMEGEVEVASAGLHAFPGEPASWEAVAVMAERGIDISGHRTACLTLAGVQQADLILTMDERQKYSLLELYPDAAGKTFMLKEYTAAPEAGRPPGAGRPQGEAARAGAGRAGQYDIPDPFGQTREAYRQCSMELTSAVADLCIDLYHRLHRSRDEV